MPEMEYTEARGSAWKPRRSDGTLEIRQETLSLCVQRRSSENMFADDQLRVAVRKWLDQNLGVVSVRKPVSYHIDEIVGAEIPQAQWIDLSSRMFLLLIEMLKQMQMPVKTLLVIPLEDISQNIVQSVPNNLAELEAQLTREPPSLYLMDWEFVKGHAICQEFSSPLPFRLFDDYIDEVAFNYREHRFFRAIENNDLYMRTIFVEHFPYGILRQ